ncbi:MAG TPA: hypothetical protein VJS12_10700 [Steroidobacteraceae bacterium]|nr:hypothetical protein [Steroidobacteraceae bacterium]
MLALQRRVFAVAGCNSDACRLANSLIEGNYVHHTNGPSVSQGDGIELKNAVRPNPPTGVTAE